MAASGHRRRSEEEVMEHAVEVPPPPRGSFGALVRAYRNRAFLSQEQLAERAELSERTVRNLEAERVRSPRNDTMRLLADALDLTTPEREIWFSAAPGANGRLPDHDSASSRRERELARIEVVLVGDAQDAFCLAVTWLVDRTGKSVLAVQAAHHAAARCCPGQIGVAVCPARPLSRGYPGCPCRVRSD